jgi:hypothetical protein
MKIIAYKEQLYIILYKAILIITIIVISWS